jgi:hypothetical protein
MTHTTHEHIIGLYRKNGKITTLTSARNDFRDKGIAKQYYVARLIPLECIPGQNDWILTPDKAALTNPLKQ